MRKAISILGVLLICSVASADVVQIESFIANMGNGVNLVIGSQSANSNNFLTVQNGQNENNTLGSNAAQSQLGFFNQNAGAAGLTANIGSLQTLISTAAQGQMVIDGVGIKGQMQTLNLGAVNMVNRAAGAGWGIGDQTMMVQQGHTGSNHLGQASQASTVFGQQTASVNGAAGSVGQAGSTTGVSVSQSQGSMVPIAP
jgi:hypothetical protein